MASFKNNIGDLHFLFFFYIFVTSCSLIFPGAVAYELWGPAQYQL